MTLKKAIEKLTELSIPGSPDLEPDDFNALKLGIEALKRISYERAARPERKNPPLPGETNE